MRNYYNIFKSVFDRIIAAISLLFFGMLFLFVIVCIKIESSGKAVFKQERIGKDEKVFYVYKFRTMKTTDVPFDVNSPIIEGDNVNLTRVGRVIRRFKIDELLQLINVAKGEMNLIGPRPLMSVYLPSYKMWERQKFLIKPGMSGLAQVKGNGHLSIAERSYYDIMYIKNHNIFTDISILIKTFGVVFFGEKRYLQRVPQSELLRVEQEYESKNS